ncbi:MAG: DUF1343 domain-containing protein [Bacteroidales bacterium]|nr:DUF1343 domain-containing protein [Bacteroidales bacterium]
MVVTGLEKICAVMPEALKGRRLGVLCHAPSITRDLVHITEIFCRDKECYLTAIFGPQHGLHGQTQDNMIEWNGYWDERLGIPVYSLYGSNRKPTPEMIEGIDAFVVDLQDAGARLYTYIWTVKLCMEACSEAGIPVWILDRPNPIARLGMDGPVLQEDYFTFVGGASIPLCHSMTIGEMAVWIRDRHIPACDLNIIRMDNWDRNSLFPSTGLPWVLPSPNLPTINSAMVYPGTVLIEALNLSEGRGTTIPFELFGAPWMKATAVLSVLKAGNLKGCGFRIHDYIPTFHKYAGELCHGIQVHVTDPDQFRPVETALHIFDAIIETSPEGSLTFNQPPYEYEEKLMPFDILAGDDMMRLTLTERLPLRNEIDRWHQDIEAFTREFESVSLYPSSK